MISGRRRLIFCGGAGGAGFNIRYHPTQPVQRVEQKAGCPSPTPERAGGNAGAASGFFLRAGKLMEAGPKGFGRLITVHQRKCGGGVSRSADSISTTRPAAASAMPCLKDSGIQ